MIRQAIQTGQPVPERIANRPELEQGNMFYLQAFFDLDTERYQGFNGPGRIPWSAMVAYAKHYGLFSYEVDDFVQIIKAVDAANSKWHSEQVDNG